MPSTPAGTGACVEGGGTSFRVWAPERRRVEVVIETPGREGECHVLSRADGGFFEGVVGGTGAGDLYRYRVDGEGPFPDPASRFQPRGVHGPSEVIDASRFRWADDAWPGLRLADLAVYELHVGTFTPAGTFAGAAERLSYLADLGVTALELMPVADFPGGRNWGYDGVSLFAPARCYGRPDDLRRLVDAAHRAGLGVALDVVYNHFGADGAYHGAFTKSYFSRRHSTPWGAAINLDGRHSDAVRSFLIENALAWVREYHVDALRLDATHALVDDGPRHFLAELSARLRTEAGRPVLLIAEDHRNLRQLVLPESRGGWGLDAVWADDFHHQMRRALAGDDEGYYADFSGSAADLAETIRRGWLFRGQPSPHLGAPRGEDPSGLPPRSFVVCLQNHDQIGNRALGGRLHHEVDLDAYRAATALHLCAPETPLLFMGQEWAATSPFLFFTDHEPELGKRVTAGRRKEFRSFRAFADPEARKRIPDPQAETTFLAGRLVWEERESEPHAGTLRLHRALLGLRRREPALRPDSWDGVDAQAAGGDTVVLRRAGGGRTLLVVARLRGAGTVDVAAPANPGWEVLLTTEDAAFCTDPRPIRLESSTPLGLRLHFARPGAVVALSHRDA